ncbi:helix-turn-helix domain-containing protein [Saccharopolyspora sp. HNM0983]|uniref:Helix-turn-helix domain-containing protein n=1 Tax=Saccharopolyspora montiporae TaxID=2781240 RepID=A0A929B8Y3_9PSEU|nr:helix-turn-helix transcriptional regulator [Saccharopolyspora sp. HNM0983]MBE9375437.1 helix-turn-helix domain-containing protein [Saccharopolyspora sp. HNM0983]
MAGTSTGRGTLGAQLRDARESAGIGLRRLALKLHTSHATLSRWESGARRPGPRDVEAYLDQVGASDERRAELVRLAAEEPPAEGFALGGCSDRLAALLAIEREATRITSVSPLLVPDLLQTTDYARAALVGSGASPSEVDLGVAVRAGRARVVTAERIPVRVFLGEHVLRQRIGGAAVMAEQVRAMREMCRTSEVELRVVPDGAGWHPGLDGPFWIGERADASPVVRIETRLSAVLLHQVDQVASYERAAAQVADAALGVARSADLLAAASDELDRELRSSAGNGPS